MVMLIMPLSLARRNIRTSASPRIYPKPAGHAFINLVAVFTPHNSRPGGNAMPDRK